MGHDEMFAERRERPVQHPAQHGVVVQVVCPGPVDTAMLDKRDPPFAPGGTKSVDVRAYLTKAAGAPMTADALATKAPI